MSFKFPAYAVNKKGGKITVEQFDSVPPKENEVGIEVTHCGVCHSDIHQIDNDWGMAEYPLVAGHEVVGVVIAKGANVKDLELGDRVGFGPQRTSCYNCRECKIERTNLCPEFKEIYGEGHKGGYGQYVVGDAKYCHKIPAGLSSEFAAPLLCAGVTVFAPLQRLGKPLPDGRVGVVGIGGLGHLALQYAKALGFKVTALSKSTDKEDEAKSFGADDFLDTSSLKVKDAKPMFDAIIVTHAGGTQDWLLELALLNKGGQLILCGISTEEVKLGSQPLIMGQKAIQGSFIGSAKEELEMLEFSDKNGIKPKIELTNVKWGENVEEFQAAVDRCRKGEARYRGVIAYSK